MDRFSRLALLIAAAVLISPNLSFSATIKVPEDHSTIQAAINAATDGDTVLVSPGTYIENINFSGKDITVGSLYLTKTDSTYISQTVIDGNANGSPVVRFQNGETGSAKLIGFTIQNGFTATSEQGAGIDITGGAAPTLERLVIENNISQSGRGGGIRCYYAKVPTIKDVTIKNNICNDMGGGIYVFASAINLINSNISNNSAPAGSAISFHGNQGGNSGGSIVNCIISNNTGGCLLTGSDIELTNCTLYNNSAVMDLYGESKIVNSIVWEGQTIYVRGMLTVSYSLIQGGKSGIVYPFEASLVWGDGNIDSDPLFLDPANENYHLQAGSPCIDSGTSQGAPLTDLDGIARPQGAGYDMGAYEYVSSGDTIRIPADYSTIQAGIDAASDGDTVLVADGTYKGTGNKNLDFKGKAITVKSENGASNCIIDCEGSGQGVYFHSGEGADSLLSGFTIRNGNAVYGGGVDCYSSSSPTIAYCTIKENTATNSGGGITCREASSPIIIGCRIEGNIAGSWGGGIQCIGSSSPRISNCLIVENQVLGIGNGGGGIDCYPDCSPVIVNCTISQNTVHTRGGGICCHDTASPTVKNSIIWANTPNEIFGTPPTITYSDIQGGYSGQGNINSDPLFVGSGDYHLTVSSPCIDVGTSSGAPDTDLEGNSRPQGSGYDMGAYEYISSSSPPTVTTGSATSVTSNSATLNGTVNPNGASSTVIFEYGQTSAYGTTVTATQSPISGTADTSVSASITALEPSTTYHFRVKATNAAGTSYGDDQTFVTSAAPVTAPVATTGSASSVTSTSATLNGTVNPNGSDTTYYFEYGTSTSYGSNTTSENAGSGSGDVSVNSSIAGLSPSTTYHYRVVATNSGGTSYGSNQTFTTPTSGSAPTVTTGSATSVTSASATLNGTINPQGLSSSYYFQYGTSASYGSTTSSTTAGSGTSDVNVSVSIDGLLPDTTYHYQLVATNTVGTNYGSDQSFTTSSSDQNPTLAIGSGTGSAGEMITLPLTLTNISGADIAAVSMDVEYETMVFDNVKATLGPAGDSAGKTLETNEVSSGLFRISVFSTSNTTAIGDGVVAYLTLKIKVGAPTGASTLTITPSGSDPSGVSVTVIGLNGTVEIISDLAGDCDGDGLVSIAEVQSAINMFLGLKPVEACVDVNENGKVSIGELQKIINNHMGIAGPSMVSFSDKTASESQESFFGHSKIFEKESLSSLIIGQALGETGETVTVPVTLQNVSGYDIAAISSDITYDVSMLENPTVQIGPAGTAAGKTVTSSEPSSGTLRIGILAVSNNNTIGNGVVAYLSFTIKAASGQTILCNSPEASDPLGNDVPITGINGSITSGEIVYVDPAGQCGGNTPCFTRIQNAIDSATSYFLIKIFEGAFDEDVVVDHTYGVVLSGGWDSSFVVQESETVIHSLTITETGGSVETANIAMQ